MGTNATRPQQAPVNRPACPPLTQEAGRMACVGQLANCAAPKLSGYGLPCSKCKLYYPADLILVRPASIPSGFLRSRQN